MTLSDASPLQRGANNIRVTLGVAGLVALVLGLVILFYPEHSGTTALRIIAALAGAYAVVTGISYIGVSIFSKTDGGWNRVGHLLLGALYAIGGVAVLANLSSAGTIIAVIAGITIGVLWLFEGVFLFVTLGESPSKLWSTILGIVHVIAGIALIFSPVIGTKALWWLLGLSLVVIGVVQMARAFAIKPQNIPTRVDGPSV